MFLSIVARVEPTGPARSGRPDDQRRETREGVTDAKLPRISLPLNPGYVCRGGCNLDPEFIRELFAPFGAVTVKRMFGGAGIWSDGLMFALVFDGAIFLKVDDASVPDRARGQPAVRLYPRQKPRPRRPRFSVILASARTTLRRSRRARGVGRPRAGHRPTEESHAAQAVQTKAVETRAKQAHMKTMTFTSPREFRAWLAKNHGRSEGIWLRLYKKDSGVATLTYAEALDQALCHGWIDGQKQPGDQQS
jgi:hypothetical protein